MAVLAFLGLPSLHEIVEAIANGFFGALANALVPEWLKHGTVATIQHLVALPDPAEWTHVGQLQGDMVYLGAMLLPVTLAVGTVRYWLVGLTGAAHPVGALGRCAWVTLVLVSYRWIVEQAVAATNTLTHGILGLPVVADGLQRIIGVLFGGALLGGAGGVFGAFLVIIGVLFAAGLFAAQVLLTVMLALLIVAGPPLIALSAIPELSHLARTWAHALLAIALVPLGWTVLFATAGALALDATSFTGRRGRPAGSRRGGVRGTHHVRDRGEAPADAARRAAPPLRRGELLAGRQRGGIRPEHDAGHRARQGRARAPSQRRVRRRPLTRRERRPRGRRIGRPARWPARRRRQRPLGASPAAAVSCRLRQRVLSVAHSRAMRPTAVTAHRGGVACASAWATPG